MTRYTILKGIKNKQERDAEDIQRIVAQLEKHGRAITTNGPVSRILSFRMKNAKRKGYIIFSWSKPSPHDERKEPVSVITLKPGWTLKRNTYRSVIIAPDESFKKRKHRKSKGK